MPVVVHLFSHTSLIMAVYATRAFGSDAPVPQDFDLDTGVVIMALREELRQQISDLDRQQKYLEDEQVNMRQRDDVIQIINTRE